MICVFSSCMDPSIAIKPVFERFQSVIITSGVNCLSCFFHPTFSPEKSSPDFWERVKVQIHKIPQLSEAGSQECKMGKEIL